MSDESRFGGTVDAAAGPVDLAALMEAQAAYRPPRRFRPGQWVTFVGDIPGAHTTADGRVVGIYRPTARVLAGVDHATKAAVLGAAVARLEAEPGGDAGLLAGLKAARDRARSAPAPSAPGTPAPPPPGPEWQPELVQVVKPDGRNLMAMQGDELVKVAFHPDILVDLRPLEEADHLPHPRAIDEHGLRRFPAGHKLQP